MSAAETFHPQASAGFRLPGRDRPGLVLPRTVTAISAFTKIELLVVIAIAAGLALLLLPALSPHKHRVAQSQCLSNLRQLGAAAQLYLADHNGRYPDNVPEFVRPKSWVAGNMQNPVQATNTALLKEGHLFPYSGQPELYRCPADASAVRGTPRSRSYVMNGWFGSRHMETVPGSEDFRTFLRVGEAAAVGPAKLWFLMDEHERTIDDGWFLMGMNLNSPATSLPAVRHPAGLSLALADGHVESFRSHSAATAKPERTESAFAPGQPDWMRLQQMTTAR